MKIAITRLLITLFEKFFHRNDPLNRARREWVNRSQLGIIIRIHSYEIIIQEATLKDNTGRIGHVDIVMSPFFACPSSEN